MSELEDYSEAIHRFVGLRSSIVSLQARYRDMAEALLSAGHAYVSNVEVSYPPHLFRKGGGVEIPGAAELPSMKELGTMLSNYQHAKEDLQKKYDAIPSPDRLGSKAPDEV